MADISLDSNIPQHVAIIMDGNGRWAKNRNLPRIEGHRNGVNNVEQVVAAAGELKIPYLTLYAFSVENWNRPKDEIDALMTLLVSFLEQQKSRLLENKIRLLTIGRTADLPQEVQDKLQEVTSATSHFTDQTLTLALNYGARTEIVDAVSAYMNTHKNPPSTWEEFSPFLYTGTTIPDPDLVIRTSGEQRISNFLLMQSAYAEFYYHPTPWPEFTKKEFYDSIAEYQGRERRFGMTSDQVTISS